MGFTIGLNYIDTVELYMLELLLNDDVLSVIEALRGCSDREAKLRSFDPWNSVRFDPHKWAQSTLLDSTIDNLVTSNTPERGYRPGRLHIHLKVVILNLLSCFWRRDGYYVAYQRGQNDYTPSSRYNELGLNRHYLVKAIDILVDLDLIDNHIGYYARNFHGESKYSRMRAKIELLRLFDPCGEIRITSHPNRECIVKRDENKNDIEYGKTAGKKNDSQLDVGMRKRLTKTNQLIAETDIKLDMTDVELRETNIALRKADRQEIDLEKIFLRRIFNENFKRGGRFYNGWWQNVPRDLRPRILIDGEPTVELDYTAIHPSIAYLEETGELPEGDPYVLSAYEGNPLMRKLVKSVLLILLNAKTPTEAKKALRRDIPKSSKLSDEAKELFMSLDLDEVFDHIRADHPALIKYMGQGMGTYLQYLDSCIADQVLTSLTEKVIVALPVHDSFIVQARHKQQLHEAMEKAFMDKWGSCPAIG